MNLTGTDICKLLKTNDRAIGRALVVLRNKQTQDEQASRSSRHDNHRGFRKQDAKRGTEDANFFEKNGYLTAEQIAYWRTNTREGQRITVYWRQLLREAYRKHYAAQEGASPKGEDSNEHELLHRYEFLKHEYSNVVDSDCVEYIKPVVDELRQVEYRLKLPPYRIGGSVYDGR